MAFQVSPGVSVAEVDLTTRIPVPSVSDGGVAGQFKWGPVLSPTMVVSEDDLREQFGKPNDSTFKSFFSAANFLAYSNKLRVVRCIDESTALNATTGASGLYVSNSSSYQTSYENTTTPGTDFIAKYPGDLGNSMKISICLPDRANTTVTPDNTISLSANQEVIVTGNLSSVLNGIRVNIDDAGVAGPGKAHEELRVGDILRFESAGSVQTNPFDGRHGIVTSVANNSSFELELANGAPLCGDAAQMQPEDKLIRLPRSSFVQSSIHGVNQMGTVSFNPATDDSRTLSGTDTRFDYMITVGDIIQFVDDNGTQQRRQVTAVTNAISLTMREPLTSQVTAQPITAIEWEFASDFETSPLTSTYAYKQSGNKDALDEIHVIVVDEDGEISATGRKDVRGKTTQKEILYRGDSLSVANNAVNSEGNRLYYKDAINSSQWIYWADHDPIGDELIVDSSSVSVAWGSSVHTTLPFNGTYNTASTPLGRKTLSFSHGTDGIAVDDADTIKGFKKFREPGEIDVSLLISGEASNTVAQYLVSDLVEYRKDCVVFVSPEESDVVNKPVGEAVANIVNRRTQLPSSSYAVMDGNYKYQYDTYNSVYRYVPFNGDIAGVCAASDNINPFVSPAGFTRGNIRNVYGMALETSRANRDDLYVNGVNPIVTPSGGGKILMGDKTLLARPSAFDRINVRRLFIILEKAIANAVQFSMFEFNDAVTRGNFVSQVTPFLREVRAARGITDFRVICDTTNNPPSVVDRNEFRGDIFIKPNRSINFISLNFVAVASGVEFNEVVNAV